MLVRTDIPKLLTAGLRKEFMEAWEGAVNDYQRVATVIPSTKDKETYAWLGGTPKMRQWKDERRPRGMSEYSFDITNDDWESSIAVDKNAIDDELYGQIKLRIRDLATETRRFFDELVFTLLNQGNRTTGAAGTILEGKKIACYDTKAFFATDHSEGLSGTQSNYTTDSLSSSSLQSAIMSMKRFKDDQGKPRHIIPDLLVTNPSKEWKAREILESVYYPEEGAETAKLAANVLKGSLDLLVEPYTEDSRWFVLCTKRTVRPIILQERKKPEFVALDTGTEAMFMRKVLYYGVDYRGMVGFGDWRTGYGAFATS